MIFYHARRISFDGKKRIVALYDRERLFRGWPGHPLNRI
jgi:hypothetical protein